MVTVASQQFSPDLDRRAGFFKNFIFSKTATHFLEISINICLLPQIGI